MIAHQGRHHPQRERGHFGVARKLSAYARVFDRFCEIYSVCFHHNAVGGTFPFCFGVRFREQFRPSARLFSLGGAHRTHRFFEGTRAYGPLRGLFVGEFVRHPDPVAGERAQLYRKVFQPARFRLAVHGGNGGDLFREPRPCVSPQRSHVEGVELVLEKSAQKGQGALLARQLVIREHRLHGLYLRRKSAPRRRAEISPRFRAVEYGGKETVRLFAQPFVAERSGEQNEPADVSGKGLAVGPSAVLQHSGGRAQPFLQVVGEQHLTFQPAFRGDASERQRFQCGTWCFFHKLLMTPARLRAEASYILFYTKERFLQAFAVV